MLTGECYDDYALSIRNRENRSEYEEAAYKRYKQAGGR